eukprot:3166406-Amphidinium_carterae.1
MDARWTLWEQPPSLEVVILESQAYLRIRRHHTQYSLHARNYLQNKSLRMHNPEEHLQKLTHLMDWLTSSAPGLLIVN